ncbi:MAG: hypothetical protein COC00_012605 [Rhizobiales bacterium]|nr:hypothetical protein [Hyphomicrobiales bacterium]
MKNSINIFIILTAILFAVPAHAASCSDIANDLADDLKAEVLSAKATGDGCKVKLKLPASNGKQSRIVTRTINN